MTTSVWLDFGDSPLEQFYVNNIAPYPREPSLYLGFPIDRKSTRLNSSH